MIFRQLHEPVSSTYTYLIGCPETGQAALLDPVLETADRDLEAVRALGLTLRYSVDTHIHADHLTGALKLKTLAGSRIAGPGADGLPCTDIKLREGEAFRIGTVTLHPLFTPGHTDHHHAYLIDTGVHKMLFSGDALLIDACGRTDFQSGDAATLYRSIHDKIFSLPDETLVYPAHDYEGRFISSVAQEKTRNPRLKDNKSQQEFVALMEALDLPYPRMIDIAVPANRYCGQCPPEIPADLRQACDNLQG